MLHGATPLTSIVEYVYCKSNYFFYYENVYKKNCLQLNVIIYVF